EKDMPFRPQVGSKGRFDSSHETSRLEVLDIASVVDPEVRALVTSAFLLYEWDRSVELWRAAGERQTSGRWGKDFYPTFLVIDEAHNVIPRDGASAYAAVLRDQVRTIAAEGRKYGLCLILCSQRPDKLDTRVISECENVA